MARPRQKALVWILRPAPGGPQGGSKGGLEILLLQRPDRRGGGFHPVTGKADRGESPAQTAAREAEEETGLSGTLRDLGLRHDFEGRNGKRFEEHAFLLSVAALATPTLSDEHTSFRWVRPDEARAALLYAAHLSALEKALAAWAGLG